MQPMIIATVHKNGSSLAVVLPSPICRALGIERGDQMVITITNAGVIQLHKMPEGERERIIKA